MTEQENDARTAVREMEAFEQILPQLRQMFIEAGSPERDMDLVVSLSDAAYNGAEAILRRTNDNSFSISLTLDRGTGEEPITFYMGVRYVSADDDEEE